MKRLSNAESDILRYVLTQVAQTIIKDDNPHSDPDYQYIANYENFIIGMSKKEVKSFISLLNKRMVHHEIKL